MANFGILASIVGAVVAIIYSLILIRLVLKNPSGSKKIEDAAKIVALEQRAKQSKNIKDFALAAVVISTGLLYALDWQVAVCFFVAASIFALIDRYLLNFSSETKVRLVEACRSKPNDIIKLNNNYSTAATCLAAGVGLLLLSVVHFSFVDQNCLIALALGAILASVFSWREGRQNSIGLYLGALTIAVVLSGAETKNFSNAGLLPIIFTVFALLVSLISGLFFRINSKKQSRYPAFLWQFLAICVLFLVGAYFAPRYVLNIFNSTLATKLSLSIAMGILFGAVILLVRQFAKILPIIAVGVAILVANYLAGTYGVALALIGFLALWPISLTLGLYDSQAKGVGVIAASADLPESATENLNSSGLEKIFTIGYLRTLLGILALSVLLLYFAKFQSYNFLATDAKLLSGLLFGGVLSYLLGLESFGGKIFKTALPVITIILAGLTLGPIFTAGIMAGAILTDLYASRSAGNEILILAMIGVLSSTFIENQYRLTIRMIIAGSAILIVAGYCLMPWLTRKFKLKTV